jgi:uncharacterized protein (TIGR03067 family)
MTTDLDGLQGSWRIVSLEMDGYAFPEQALAGASLVIEGDQFTSLGMGTEYRGTIRVDSSSAPKSFAMHFTAGPERGNVNLGIYEIDDSCWRICLATRGSTRPQKFASQSGTGIALEVLRRMSS